METFTCHRCGETKPIQTNGGTGYATDPATDRKICYACCALYDIEYMAERDRTTLYLSETRSPETPGIIKVEITNWPGTLRMRPTRIRRGFHNIAGSRVDVWFTDPNGAHWWGVQYGKWTQILHCRKIKA